MYVLSTIYMYLHWQLSQAQVEHLQLIVVAAVVVVVVPAALVAVCLCPQQGKPEKVSTV